MKQSKHILIYLFLLSLFAIGNEAKAESVTITLRNVTSDVVSFDVSGEPPAGAKLSVSTNSSSFTSLTAKKYQCVILKGFGGYKITKITLEMHSNTDSGAGYLAYKIGNEGYNYIVGSSGTGIEFREPDWYGNWSMDYKQIEKTVNIIPEQNEDVQIWLTSTAYFIGCKSYTITYERPSLTIGLTGYATFCAADATDFSDTGLNVYTASVSGHVARLTKIESGQVAAGEGVIVRGPAYTSYSIPVIRSEIGKVTENELVGTTEVTTVKKTSDGKYNYLLQSDDNNGNGGIVFRMALDGGAKLAAGRAYLSTSYDAASGARLSIALPNEDEVTSIEGTAPRPKPMPHHATHDLLGRKIGSTTARGIKIVDGKKILR